MKAGDIFELTISSGARRRVEVIEIDADDVLIRVSGVGIQNPECPRRLNRTSLLAMLRHRQGGQEIDHMHADGLLTKQKMTRQAWIEKAEEWDHNARSALQRDEIELAIIYECKAEDCRYAALIIEDSDSDSIV